MSAVFTGRPLRVLGIDFGSASIKVAAKVNNTIKDVSLLEDVDTLQTHLRFKGNEILLGSTATAKSKKDYEGYISNIKRTLGVNEIERDHNRQGDWLYETKYGNYTFSLNSCMAAAILFDAVRKSVKKKIEVDITDVVLTIPVKFTEEQKQALVDAALIAGYSVVSVIVEPVASCFNFVGTMQTSLGDRFIMLFPSSFYIISYDFGGSTFDTAVVYYDNGKYSVMATDGDKDLGGRRIESEIVDHVMSKYNIDPEKRSQIQMACANVISEANNQNSPFIYPEESGVQITLTTEEVNDIIVRFAERASTIVETMIKRLALTSKAVVFVYMTGGISMVNAVKESVKHRFPDFNVMQSSSLHSVSRGALIYGERSMLNKQKSMRQLLKYYSNMPAAFEMRDSNSQNLIICRKDEQLPLSISLPISLPACPDSRYVANFYAIYDADHEEKMNNHIRINRVKSKERAKLTVEIDNYLEVSCSIEGETITYRDRFSEPLPEKRRTTKEVEMMKKEYEATLDEIKHGCILEECRKRLRQLEKRAKRTPSLKPKYEEYRARVEDPATSREVLVQLSSEIINLK